MNTKHENFIRAMCEQHLEEASFLHDQRLALSEDPQASWLDLEDLENRLEAHIDALVIGEQPALTVCQTPADAGELHATVRVFCRQEKFDLLQKLLADADLSDEETGRAIRSAIESKPGSQPNGRPELQALRKSLDKQSEDSPETEIMDSLRRGDRQAIELCGQAAPDKPWARLALALCGGPADVRLLAAIADSEKADESALLALGLLGDPSSFETLLKRLETDELAPAAARGLNLITGAELYEEAFIPEEVDEDELFEDELEKLRKGESLTPDGEQPPGMTVSRLAQSQKVWLDWLRENKSQFKATVRYRNGKPYSPECLIENLRHPKSPRRIRRLAYEELVIRYGVEFQFNTDMFVAQQKLAIAELANRQEKNECRFPEGEWYFAGSQAKSERRSSGNSSPYDNPRESTSQATLI